MNRRLVTALLVKETRELVRDPVTMTLAVIMPLIMLFLFGYAINLDVDELALGIYDQDNTPTSRALVDRFVGSPYFEIIEYSHNVRDLDRDLQRSSIRAGIVIPPGFGRALLREQSAPVQVIVDGSYPMIAGLGMAYIDAVIAHFPTLRPEPVAMATRVWYNPSLSSVNFVIPGLFAVILMAFPPLLTTLAIVREKETGTVQQIYASPLRSSEYVLGKLLPYAVVAFLEILMVILVGFVWFEIPIAGSLPLLFFASLVYVFTTVGIGMLVSSIASTQLAAMLITLIITLMPSFLFSGFLFPIFTMPLSLQMYSRLFPAGYFMEVSRGILLKGLGIEAVLPNLLLLIAYTLVVFVFATWRMKQKVA